MIARGIILTSLLLFCAAPHAVPADKRAPIKLYGQIDELSFLTSSAGIRLTSNKFPSNVSKVSLGSAGAYSGLREGDKVFGVRATDSNLLFSIERNGKRYEANVATDVNGLKSEFETRKIPYSFGDGAFDKELQTLTKCELVFLLDRSASMADNHAGVPGDLSKWSWCRQQIDNFYLSTTKFFERGFDIVTFNDKSTRWKNVSLWDMKQVFARFKPDGLRKDIATPLQEIIHDYVRARKPESKPLIVIVLTDGLKNEGPPLQSVLIEASRKQLHHGEINVVFMQIGDSIFAEELFDDLDRNLMAKGSKFDIAQFKPFGQLRNKGILWELLTTVKEIEATGATATRNPR